MNAKKVLVVLGVFLLGIVVGIAGSETITSRTMFIGKTPQEAASALLAAAESQAEDGTWERIGVARVYYLSGDKERGQLILDKVLRGKMKKGDWMRIARIYVEAKEWSKAKEIFDKVIKLDPEDNSFLTEIGAYHNLHGERERAEELFERSIKINAEDNWTTTNMAGSYLGVKPQ